MDIVSLVSLARLRYTLQRITAKLTSGTVVIRIASSRSPRLNTILGSIEFDRSRRWLWNAYCVTFANLLRRLSSWIWFWNLNEYSLRSLIGKQVYWVQHVVLYVWRCVWRNLHITVNRSRVVAWYFVWRLSAMVPCIRVVFSQRLYILSSLYRIQPVWSENSRYSWKDDEQRQPRNSTYVCETTTIREVGN